MSKTWLIAAIFLSLVGCGGGGSTGGPAPEAAADTGSVTLSVTDAEGDFLTYTVDLVSVELLRRNGDIVQVLPRTTRIDFADLTRLAEIVGVQAVPAGAYESVRLTLDYANADIQAQDDAGAVIALTPLNSDGGTLARLTSELELANRDHIVVSRGVNRAFALDFDLAASNTIDLVAGSVLVAPFLVAEAELDVEREHRVRGALAEVNLASSFFDLRVRPFHHNVDEFGGLRVNTDAQTEFEIDGEAATGAAGLEALNRLAAGSAVAALGAIELTGGERRFVASSVLAGSSVPGAMKDGVRGVVVARSGDRLTVRGTRWSRARAIDFRPEILVLVSDETRVVSALRPALPRDKDSISVGQVISVLGDLDSTGVLNAEQGGVRLEATEALGRAVPADNGLALDLRLLGSLRPTAFDFTGTGANSVDDADPTHYEVDVGDLNLAGVAADDLLRVRGEVTAFGEAPPDFRAVSLLEVALDTRAAELLVVWGPNGSPQPFESVSADALILSEEARQVLHLRGARIAGDVVESIVPAADRGRFALRVRGSSNIRFYDSFAEFTAELTAQLNSGKRVLRLHAGGQFSRSEQRLTTHRLLIDLSAS